MVLSHAELTAAHIADNAMAQALLGEMPAEVRYVLGDRHYNAPNVRERCETEGCELVASRYGRYPHTDGGGALQRHL